MTNKGICYAYNAGSFHENLANTTYNNYFKNIFGSIDQMPNEDIKTLNAGFKMSLILDSHQTSVSGYENGHFEVAINQQSDGISVLRNTIKAEVGQKTLIKVNSIIQYKMTEKFAELEQDSRECFNENEGSNKLIVFR